MEFVEPVNPAEQAEQGGNTVRKLTRSRDNKWLAGVSGGLAEYFRIDPAIVRILFVILACTGSGIVIYLLAWLIIPLEGETGSIGDSLVRKTREGRSL